MMNKLYMGIDAGSVMIKGVIIDKNDNIITSNSVYTEGEPIKAVKKLINKMRLDIDLDKYRVVAIGVTGIARKLIGTLLEATVIKNEIMAQTEGTVKMYPEVKTIIEMGGHDSKIICINNGMVFDYGISTSCNSGMGLSTELLMKKFNVNYDDIYQSKNMVDIVSKCPVFMEADLLHKISDGYKKEEVLRGLYYSLANNYLCDVTKGKKIIPPIVFNGGVSKNLIVAKALSELLHEKIIVNANSHLMGAFGMAVIARESKKEKIFDFDIDQAKIETKMESCLECSYNCKVIKIYKNDNLIDSWGNRCGEEKNVKKSNLVV